MARYGGIDLGGTKIQAVVVDDAHDGARLRAPPDADHRGPCRRRARDGRRGARGARRRPASARASSRRSASAHPAPSTRRPARSRARATCPTGRARTRSARSSPRHSTPRSRISNDVNVATQAEFELGAGKPYRSILGVFWGTGVGGGIVLDGQMWEGRGAAGEIGHVVVKSDGRKCPCGRIGCMEAYAGRGAMEVHARQKVADGEKTVLFDIMEERGKPRLSSGIWQRALDQRRQAGPPARRPRGRGDRRRGRLLAQPARRRRGDHRRRPGPAPRRSLRREDPRGDDAAPVRRPPPAGGAARLARRPRRRGRRDAARGAPTLA